MDRQLESTELLARIESLEEAIRKGREYLESGEHAHWHAFRPWFKPKLKDGKELPPHNDWVRNVFIPQLERALSRAEKMLWMLERNNSSNLTN
jgi:hypothetical protein